MDRFYCRVKLNRSDTSSGSPLIFKNPPPNIYRSYVGRNTVRQQKTIQQSNCEELIVAPHSSLTGLEKFCILRTKIMNCVRGIGNKRKTFENANSITMFTQATMSPQYPECQYLPQKGYENSRYFCSSEEKKTVEKQDAFF